jgi:hypothetical protein
MALLVGATSHIAFTLTCGGQGNDFIQISTDMYEDEQRISEVVVAIRVGYM